VIAIVDPNSELGETRTRRGRRKDIHSAVPTRRTKGNNMLPINELTWLEQDLRYILGFLMNGNLESSQGSFIFANYLCFHFLKTKVIYEDSSYHSLIRMPRYI